MRRIGLTDKVRIPSEQWICALRGRFALLTDSNNANILGSSIPISEITSRCLYAECNRERVYETWRVCACDPQRTVGVDLLATAEVI
jgi:hypothetical protein